MMSACIQCTKTAKNERESEAQHNQDKPRPTTTGKTNNVDERKKTGAGTWPRCSHGTRCMDPSGKSRPGGRNIRGNSNHERVWVSPAPVRERERKKRRRWTSQQKEENESGQLKTQQERVGFKRHQPNELSYPRGERATRKNQQRPRENRTQTKQYQQRLRGICSKQGGEAHGLPCTVGEWGDTPRDRGTEGSEDPPTTGTAPVAQTLATCQTRSEYPKRCWPSS